MALFQPELLCSVISYGRPSIPLFVTISVYQPVWLWDYSPAGDAASHNSSTAFGIWRTKPESKYFGQYTKSLSPLVLMNTPAAHGAPIYAQIVCKHLFAAEEKSQSVFQERWRCLCSCSSGVDTAAEKRHYCAVWGEQQSSGQNPGLPDTHRVLKRLAPSMTSQPRQVKPSSSPRGLPIAHWRAVVTFPKNCLSLHWLQHFSGAHEQVLYKSHATRSPSVNSAIKV